MNLGWAANVLQGCMGLRPGERVLALVDEPLRPAGEALCAAAASLGAAAADLRVITERRGLAVVPEAFLRQVREADVIVSLMSGLDLQAESPFLRAGLAAFRSEGRGRWAAGACIDEDILQNELAGDFGAVAASTKAAAARLAGADWVRVTTPAGTDLRFRLGGRPVHQDSGEFHAPGAYGNLPPGEAFVAPLEDTAEGRLVVDLSLGDIPLDEPVVLTFRGGLAAAVEGGAAARELERRLGAAGAGARVLCELGLGTNPWARIRRRAPLDEKVLGTAHVALGGNAHFGGANSAETHYDCVFSSPCLSLDVSKAGTT